VRDETRGALSAGAAAGLEEDEGLAEDEAAGCEGDTAGDLEAAFLAAFLSDQLGRAGDLDLDPDFFSIAR